MVYYRSVSVQFYELRDAMHGRMQPVPWVDWMTQIHSFTPSQNVARASNGDRYASVAWSSGQPGTASSPRETLLTIAKNRFIRPSATNVRTASIRELTTSANEEVSERIVATLFSQNVLATVRLGVAAPRPGAIANYLSEKFIHPPERLTMRAIPRPALLEALMSTQGNAVVASLEIEGRVAGIRNLAARTGGLLGLARRAAEPTPLDSARMQLAVQVDTAHRKRKTLTAGDAAVASALRDQARAIVDVVDELDDALEARFRVLTDDEETDVILSGEELLTHRRSVPLDESTRWVPEDLLLNAIREAYRDEVSYISTMLEAE